MITQGCLRAFFNSLLLSMAVFTVLSSPTHADDPATQTTPLEGLWEIEKNFSDGQDLPLLDFQYRFYGLKADFMASGEVFVTYDVKVDLKQDPPHFDLVGEKDGTTYIEKGVFRIEGDKLIWSSVNSKDEPRPTRVSKSAFTMQVLRRIPDTQSEKGMPPAPKVAVGSKQTSPLPAPAKFKLQWLNAGAGKNTGPSDINSAGMVLGESGQGVSKRACIWNDGKHEVLEGFDLDHAAVYAINDHGTVAGSHVFQAYAKPYYQLDGKLYPMEFDVKYPFALPYSINIHRQVVGVSFLPMDVTNSWLWDDGKVKGLRTLGGWSNEAMAINDDGQIAGFSTMNENRNFHAYILKGNDIKDLGTFGGSESKAYDLNQAGEVVGYAKNKVGDKRAFLWSGEQLTQLPPLATGKTSWAWSINDTGWVVGWSSTNIDKQVAIVWHDGKAYDLQKLVGDADGWKLDIARAVNNVGTIVGTASKNGSARGFMLTPVIANSRARELD